MPAMKARFLAALIPYAAVLIGIHGMENAWAAMGLYHLAALIFLVLHRGGPGWRSLVRGWRWSSAWPLIVLGALAGPVVVLVFPWAELPSETLAARLSDLGLSGGTRWLFFVYYVAVTPVIEETLWRGKLGSPARGLAASDVLFAGYHVLVLVRFLTVPWVGFAFLALVGTAWLWRRTAERSGGLAVPVVSHLAGDLSLMLAVHRLL